jgi:hypothetical protein
MALKPPRQPARTVGDVSHGTTRGATSERRRSSPAAKLRWNLRAAPPGASRAGDRGHVAACTTAGPAGGRRGRVGRFHEPPEVQIESPQVFAEA